MSFTMLRVWRAPAVTPVSAAWLRANANHLSDDWLLRLRSGQLDHLVLEPDDSAVVWTRERARRTRPS